VVHGGLARCRVCSRPPRARTAARTARLGRLRRPGGRGRGWLAPSAPPRDLVGRL